MYFMYIEMQVCDMARHRTENNTTMLTLIVDDNRQHDQEKTKKKQKCSANTNNCHFNVYIARDSCPIYGIHRERYSYEMHSNVALKRLNSNHSSISTERN